MALTVEAIQSAKEDESLFDLLSAELQRLLPEDVREYRDRYHAALRSLPRGLRPMAGVHFFDVSMTLDSIEWHFGNQNDERDLEETLDGLREPDLPEIADRFAQMWEFMKPHLLPLKAGRLAATISRIGWLRLGRMSSPRR